jgi:alpha-L-fucosidase 2
MIAGSQPNGQPTNLQGKWNDRVKPAWDSKYTININTEMNYWPSEPTNLSELGEPLFKMLKN